MDIDHFRHLVNNSNSAFDSSLAKIKQMLEATALARHKLSLAQEKQQITQKRAIAFEVECERILAEISELEDE